jgi:hypothetical protein
MIKEFTGENKNPFPEQSEMLSKIHKVVEKYPNASVASVIGVLELVKFNLMIETATEDEAD